MSKRVLVVSPHPDDETLGVGGTLLKHRAAGDEIFWLNFTSISEPYGFQKAQIEKRAAEIQSVIEAYGFKGFFNLELPTTHLDEIPMGEMIGKTSSVFKTVQPEVLYLPFRSDVHSDHTMVFDTVAACTKWFRYESVKRVLVYETASETEFGINPDSKGFQPNVYMNISPFIDKKIEILNIYESEMGVFPFPRSEVALRSLAAVRGMASGFLAAEAFMLLRERQ